MTQKSDFGYGTGIACLLCDTSVIPSWKCVGNSTLENHLFAWSFVAFLGDLMLCLFVNGFSYQEMILLWISLQSWLRSLKFYFHEYFY